MKTISVCAWCFPGLLVVNGLPVSHGICRKHQNELELRVGTYRLEKQFENEVQLWVSSPSKTEQKQAVC